MSSLAPALLVSMPQLVDPNFNRSVVLLCKHKEDGAFGLVINRPLVTSGRMVVQYEASGAAGAWGSGGARRTGSVSSERDLEVWIGGPMEPQRSWILIAEDDATEGSVRIADGVSLSTSPALLQRLLGAEPPPRTRLIVGYSGWGPGQLDAELHASAWLISDVDCELIFATPAERMWEAAIRRLGADPAALQMSRGVR